MKRAIYLPLIGLLAASQAPAMEMKNRIAYAYVAAGQLYGVGTARLGRNSFELGVITPGAFGLGKAIRDKKGIGIATFGLAYNYTKSYGIYGSVGAEFKIFPFLNFRGEVIGSVYNDTANYAGVLLGGVFHL